jgi:hypothetical protein
VVSVHAIHEITFCENVHGIQSMKYTPLENNPLYGTQDGEGLVIQKGHPPRVLVAQIPGPVLLARLLTLLCRVLLTGA